MSWMDKTRKNEGVPNIDATNATNRPFVAFVAYQSGIPANFHAEKIGNAPNQTYRPSAAEIATLTERQARFERQGLPTSEAEELAERLLLRDRDPSDDRRLCLECGHCISGRCANAKNAGFIKGDAVGDLAVALHRCPGYAAGDGSMAPRPPEAPLRPPKRASLHLLGNEQRDAATAYLAHHWRCRQCQAAGLGDYGERCGEGLALWSAYQFGENA